MDAVQDFDIAKNVKLIEILKSQLLTNVADLYSNLSGEGFNLEERENILSDLLIITYMLSNRLGFSHTCIDTKAIKKLRLSLLDEKQVMYTDMQTLVKHLTENFKESLK